ncbi:MAG: SufD family Fe-S cluster assembly protein [Chitinophagales bacterium]|nr:SufD family Fe-S cluster assembly protein [Chitinophagales bacterium]
MRKKELEIPGLNEKLLAGMHFLEAGMNGNRNSIVNRLRQPAMEKFRQSGFPSPKNEEWRFTPIESSLKKISRLSFDSRVLSSETEAFIASLEPSDAYKVIVVNSRPVFFSTPDNAGVELMSISDAQKKIPLVIEKHYGKYLSFENETFSAINTALSKDGIVLHIKDNITLDKPLHIIYAHDNHEEGNFCCSRILVVLEEGAKASITETHIALSTHFSLSNIGAEIKVSANARVDYYLVQHLAAGRHNLQNEESQQRSFSFGSGSTEASIIDNRQVSLDKDSYCNFTTVTLSGQLVRNNLNVQFDGTNGESHLYGLYLPSGNELFDNHTLVDHATPSSFSKEFYKGIISGNGKGVFNGKILVRKDAQKTNAYQNNKNLLLSDEAHVNAKPQLEIFADDVKCTHGATTGQLDQDALFYLQARGIGKNEAKKMLTVAFAADMLSQILHEPLHQQLERWIEEKLSQP